MNMDRYLRQKCISKLPSAYNLEILDQVDSTNEYLKRKLKDSTKEGLCPNIAVAIRQTAGRGTKGRAWIDFGNCLKFSVLIPFENKEGSIRFLTPFMALNLLRALSRYTNDPLCVKWPNDLYCNGGKCVGILVEALRKNTQAYLIAGIGINLVREERLDKLTGRRTGALHNFASSDLVDFRTEVFVAAANAIIKSVHFLPHTLTNNFVSAWKEVDMLLGQTVRLMEGDKLLFEGKNLGIDEDGRILLSNGYEIKAFAIGEASLKL